MRPLAALPALLSASLLGCGAGEMPGDSQCAGGKCDDPRQGVDDSDIEPFACDGVFVNRSSRRNPDGSDIERFVGRLKDPLTELVYRDGDCPLTLEGIMAKLKEAESDCGELDGIATRIVSEEGQILPAELASYRAVTSKSCGDRAQFELLFSSFGLRADTDELPRQGVEVIAFDRTAGVFNYYKEVGGKMGFFGGTLDYVFDGPQGPALTDVNGCANCHAGTEESGRGNLNMKELRVPWMHWEGSAETAGADELISRFSDTLGRAKGGPDLESVVKAGNRRNNATVIAALREARDYRRLLRPLFCTEQLHVATGTDNRIPASFMVAPRLGGRTLTVKASGYNDLIAAIDQKVPGTDIADTRFKFAYLERSFDDIDWVDQLIEAQIIDRQFALDVLAVDFTRPIFSDARCDLHELAPEPLDLDPDDLGPGALRAHFLEALAGAAPGTPAAQLRAHFEATEAGAAIDHAANVEAFLAACDDRDDNGAEVTVEVAGTPTQVSGFQADAMKLRSRDRQLAFELDGVLDDADGSDARPRKVFEFPRTFPEDAIRVTTGAAPGDPLAVHPEARLHPVDCTLVTGFTPVPGG